MFSGRTVLVGACGGIALFKVPLLISRLREGGATVHVIMTEAATRFVAPLTFQTVSGNPVHTDMWAPPTRWNVEHIALAERAELAVIAPATANIIGKAAGGVADNFLSTTILALRCPVLYVPAMNPAMWDHPAVRRNVSLLREFGAEVMTPDSGRLASGAYGAGRYPETERIAAACARLLGPGDLTGRRVLVTAGPTREPFDPVRFISNPSTGRMGIALAGEARRRGGEVTLVHGPVGLPLPPEVEALGVVTTEEMRRAVLDRVGRSDVLIMAAAPVDWRPAAFSEHKLKKSAASGDLTAHLAPTSDILAEAGRDKGKRVLVGFAAETGDLEAHARTKLEAKNLDLIVANQVAREPGVGFGAETNRVLILGRDGAAVSTEVLPKTEIARIVLDHVSRLLRAGDAPYG